uniref:Ribosomal protein L19 n=1 Tax=Lactuca sativa TaxID=4236 RepID=A0A9R1V7G1_LACSA|nr:hypothetical protein LSAT_V11C600323680 [Lactuca sativa]
MQISDKTLQALADSSSQISVMASVVLSQALYMIPTDVAKFESKKLRVSSFLPQFNAASVSISTVSSYRCRRNYGFRCGDSLVVRAEADAGAEADPEPETKTVAAETTEKEDEEEVEEKKPKKAIVKLGDIMGILNKQAVEASESARPVPDLRTGDIIEIKLEVPENRRRLSVYKGIIISRQNAGIHTTIRIRRIIAGVGVEIILSEHQRNKSGEASESPKSKVVLSARQTSQALNF